MSYTHKSDSEQFILVLKRFKQFTINFLDEIINDVEKIESGQPFTLGTKVYKSKNAYSQYKRKIFRLRREFRLVYNFVFKFMGALYNSYNFRADKANKIRNALENGIKRHKEDKEKHSNQGRHFRGKN